MSRDGRGQDARNAPLVIGAALLLSACAGGATDERVTDTASASAVAAVGSATMSPPIAQAGEDTGGPTPPSEGRQPADAPARDADQDFLHHMLDHHETVVTAVHAQMMNPEGHASHGTAMDPSEWDARLDDEKREMLALLKKHYGEDCSPRPASMPPSTAAARRGAMAMRPPAAAPGEQVEAEHMAGQVGIVSQLRGGASLTDRFAPRLKRRDVRDLAARVRTSQLELARKVEAGMKTPGMKMP